MNYFFGIKSDKIKSRLAIPRFQNTEKNQLDYFVYQCKIQNQHWILEKIKNCEINSNFFLINENLSNNENIFFIAKENEINFSQYSSFKELANINNFTNHSRCNLQISNNFGGFSSFQSEYPFRMISSYGSIFAPLSVLTNKLADNNYIFIKNIFKEPIKKEFKIYFIDIKNKEIIRKEKIYTNTTNCIKIEKNLIKPEVYIFTDKYLGVPIFVSEKDNHLSIEHTHPPHEYILSADRYDKVKELKLKIHEIIHK